MERDPHAGSVTGPGTAGQVALDSSTGRRVIATTVAGSAVAMLTATVVNVALPALATSLDASSSQQQWVVNAYLLSLASLILIGGSLGDRYGRLRMYHLGVGWFGLASLACAVAPTVEVLIAARLLQGVGGALLTPGSLAIIESTLRKPDRGRGVGQWSGLSGIAGAIGPLVGGLLVDASWRWVFVLNLPVVVAVLVLSKGLPESRDEGAAGSSVDGLGAALTVAALGGLTFGLIEGPNQGWATVEIAALVMATVSVLALVVIEPGRDHAMIPLTLFAVRAFAVANLITLLVYGGMGVVFFLLSIQLQVTAGWSPIGAGAALLPVTLLMLALSSRAGDLAQRIGPSIPLTVGPLLIASGMLLYTRIGAEADYVSHVLPAVVVFGLGLAASVAPVTATVLGAAPDDRAGAASGTNNAVARTGQLLAVAAIPPLVGLTGDALGDPEALAAGFDRAMVVAAGLVASGGLASALLLRPDDVPSDEAAGPPVDHHLCCPVDGVPAMSDRG